MCECVCVTFHLSCLVSSSQEVHSVFFNPEEEGKGHVLHHQRLNSSRWEMVGVVEGRKKEEYTGVGYLSLITVYL